MDFRRTFIGMVGGIIELVIEKKTEFRRRGLAKGCWIRFINCN